MFFVYIFKFIGDIVTGFEPDAKNDFNDIFTFIGNLLKLDVSGYLYPLG